ncbi:MAG: cell division protein FtsQ/DivIB, partial [Pseudomonadota bacterium]
RRSGPDPAPSKWRYRMERLWLTPLFRALVRVGIPAAVLIAGAAWYLRGEGRVEAIVDGWSSTVQAIQDRPEFTVSLLRIEGASAQLQADIEEALPVKLPLSQFQLDMARLREALLGLDPVADAEVRVVAGGTLLLRVTERTPAVAWLHEGQVEVLDAVGHRVATLDSLEEAGPLPVIAGEGAGDAVAEALRLVAAAAPVMDDLVGLTRVGNRRWDVILTGGKRIALPEAAPTAALDRALAMDAAVDVLDRNVTLVDLRLPGRPVLRLTEPAREELRVIQELERSSYSEDR